MRFKVPQNIDMQDRIVGPLTMTQFIYAVVGGGLTYGAYSAFDKSFSLILAIPIALLTFCMVFVKINEQPFLRFASFVINFFMNPQKRIWQQIDHPSVKVQIYKVEKKKEETVSLVTDQEISSLAGKIDSSQERFH